MSSIKSFMLAAFAAVALAVTLIAPATHVTAQNNPATPRHLGYGVSIGPHLEVPPGQLTDLGMDWVLVYDTRQIPLFPDQHVLYRYDVRGYPTNIDSWEHDTLAMALQLKNSGVMAVAIGNEPNLMVEWGHQRLDPRLYADILCRGYRIFKQAAPDIVIVSAGLAPTLTSSVSMNDLDFAQQMLSAGAGKCFDAFGYHPYGYNQPPETDPSQTELTFRRTERMYRLLQNNGIEDKQIWLTEFGWVRDPGEEGMNCSGDSGFQDFQWMVVSRQVQADYVTRAYQFADNNWLWAGPMFLWNLNWSRYSPGYEPACSHLRWFAMFTSKGEALPVYQAYRNMPKRPPLEYGPLVGARIKSMTRVVEAGCAGVIELGSFTVVNRGYPGELEVAIEPANGPGAPLVIAGKQTARSGDEVQIVVDTRGVKPGLYMIPINLRSINRKVESSAVVRGWLLLHYPTSPECAQRYNSSLPVP